MPLKEDHSQVIPLVEETVQIAKEEVVTGRIRVRTFTEETEHLVDQDLETQTVQVSRIPVDREVVEAPAVRQEGDVTIISLVEEIVVVTKRLMVREEVHIRRITSTERAQASITLRKQHAIVERIETGDESRFVIATGEGK